MPFHADGCWCPGDQYYSSVLEDIQFEDRDFKADSWSTAVDSSYLQTHRKDLIKRQDVIYGDPGSRRAHPGDRNYGAGTIVGRNYGDRNYGAEATGTGTMG